MLRGAGAIAGTVSASAPHVATGMYIAMNAAAARAEHLDAVADNLANANTVAFKASRPAFEAFLAPGGAPVGYVAAVSTGVDLRAGARQATGRAMDLTPEGDAFLSVRAGSGEPIYTRDGRVELDAAGQLRVPAGVLLDRDGKPISVATSGAGQGPIEIARSGAILQGGVEVARLGLFRLEGPLERVGPAAVQPDAGRVTAAAGLGVHVGELELANFSALEAMVTLVSAQRHFDSAMQAIDTYRKIGQGSNLGLIR